MSMKTGDQDDSIVALLQLNGRASFSDLARSLGIPRAAVAARVGELVQSGALQLMAGVHPRVLGLNALAHIAIRLAGPSKPVVDALVELDAAAFVSHTTGPYAMVTELRYATMDELYAGIDALRAIPEVSDTNVLIYHDVLRSFFLGEEPDLPDLVLDDIDLRLIAALQLDGRLSYRELGRRVGLSVSASRARVQRLLETHVLQIGAIRGRRIATKGATLGFGITTSGDAQAVVEVVDRIPGVEFIARCFGCFDLVVTMATNDLFATPALLDELRAMSQVDTVTSWVHLQILKEHYNMSLDRLSSKYVLTKPGPTCTLLR